MENRKKLVQKTPQVGERDGDGFLQRLGYIIKCQCTPQEDLVDEIDEEMLELEKENQCKNIVSSKLKKRKDSKRKGRKNENNVKRSEIKSAKDEVSLCTPQRTSEERLNIGDEAFYRYYKGRIRELKRSNRKKDRKIMKLRERVTAMKLTFGDDENFADYVTREQMKIVEFFKARQKKREREKKKQREGEEEGEKEDEEEGEEGEDYISDLTFTTSLEDRVNVLIYRSRRYEKLSRLVISRTDFFRSYKERMERLKGKIVELASDKLDLNRTIRELEEENKILKEEKEGKILEEKKED